MAAPATRPRKPAHALAAVVATFVTVTRERLRDMRRLLQALAEYPDDGDHPEVARLLRACRRQTVLIEEAVGRLAAATGEGR